MLNHNINITIKVYEVLQLNSLGDTSVMACDKRTIKVYARAPNKILYNECRDL